MCSREPSGGRVVVSGLELRPGEDPARLLDRALDRLGLAGAGVRRWSLLRRSLDARGARQPRWICTVGLELSEPGLLQGASAAMPWDEVRWTLRRPTALDPGEAARPIVGGAGPAGLFAALRLCAYGFRPILFERGAELDERVRDVARYWKRGELDPESNVQFGEGGAGTFSDGKLTYRGKDFRKGWVLEQLVAVGAPPETLFDSRAHLGTDRLRGILRRLRAVLGKAGATFRFRTRVERLCIRDGRACGVELEEGPVAGPAIFLAAGHSARDLLRSLAAQGVELEPKGFAVGLRVEVGQRQVDECQYGHWAGSPHLSAAEFTVKARAASGRDVYSFCMCPGGVVIPAGSEPGGLVINGMSAAGRTGGWANAALVVPCSPEDYGGGPLGGFRFQEELERYAARLGGERGVPAQRVSDFLAGRASRTLPPSSCPWPLVSAPLESCLPPFVGRALR
ncbi:MAG: hypothetical protein HY900_02810 [Deltaproteobacteria bacterium]|nr:hypothetical protein [Deltaproteobacteria bacterium]